MNFFPQLIIHAIVSNYHHLSHQSTTKFDQNKIIQNTDGPHTHVFLETLALNRTYVLEDDDEVQFPSLTLISNPFFLLSISCVFSTKTHARNTLYKPIKLYRSCKVRMFYSQMLLTRRRITLEVFKCQWGWRA